ncbi:MAG TPA: hypothetical protein VH370_23615 [Humisphaera sp.]|nr:hypothetical protein [Humisphaera sp.]
MGEQISWLLIEEYFSVGDDRFIDALRQFHVPGRLATIADRWKKEPRPWARSQILAYLDHPLDAPAHETAIKRLFKNAEDAKDDELMAAFAVAFDRNVRRVRKTEHGYDWRTRQSWTDEVLRTPLNVIRAPALDAAREGPVKPQWKPMDVTRIRRGKRLFTYRTRFYLRRRAWRYFRKMGFSRSADYPAAVARMLAAYRDEDLARGENILDSWCLLHACFYESPILKLGANHAKLVAGQALRDLAPAPQFPELWKTPSAGQSLLELLINCKARLVRVWAMQLLRRDHADFLRQAPMSAVRRLLEHPDPDAQLMGAQILENLQGLEKLPVEEWLQLLETQNLTALETIAATMSRHVTGQRLSLDQCVKLACARPAPVARMGLSFLRSKEVRTSADLQSISSLANAQCASLGGEICLWAMSHLASKDNYNVDFVSRFFDSILAEIREAAWTAMKRGQPAWDDAALWSRLAETPYDDVRLRFVNVLRERTSAPGMNVEQLSAVWVAVLLGIHRGGRHKLTALRQISDAVRNDPTAAPRLLPVLALAIRSVRAPEARAGLAAIVAAVDAQPDLAAAVSRELPELILTPAEAPA